MRRVLFAVLALLVVGLVIMGAASWRGLGQRASGERRARMEKSPEWDGARFENPQPLRNDGWGMLTHMLHISPHASPKEPLDVLRSDGAALQTLPVSGLRVTWFGHSSTLVEIDGTRVLTDPMWSERPTPFAPVGPKRWYPPPLSLTALPKIDVVVISHDHYDHLDAPTITALNATGARFVTALGVGAHLAFWGVQAERLTELDWWEETQVGELSIVSVPARHASGRGLLDKDMTLWTGYALKGKAHRVYFSGDTGLFPAMRDIGARHGPFDLTLIEVGQYDSAWPDWHIGPEQAVRAHTLVNGRTLLPIHWGLLTLAYHGWTEPVERALAAAALSGVKVATPRPGESIELDTPTRRWWPELPWRKAAEAPIVSTQMDE